MASNQEITISKDIFRTYDIRGQIGREWCLDEDYTDAFLIGQAIGDQLIRRNSPRIIIGRDGRNSSPAIAAQLTKGLLSVGCQVTDIGLVATPVLYFSLDELAIPNAVMVTGSHNPADHNGIKIVYDNAPLSGIVIESLYYDIKISNFCENNKGKLIQYDTMLDDYQQAIINNIRQVTLDRPLKIGIDCGNGATSLFAEALFSKLGYEVYPLFCELDGNFPNHSPDPTVPQNLSALAGLVKSNALDLGIAFDGDGDRMIASDASGKILWPDRIMILLAQDILQKQEAARVIFDVKCSYLLPKFIQHAGGQPAMCASGHSILKMHMTRLDAALGGEFSGHIVLRDRWSDFDDGPYVAARLLEVLSKQKQQNNLSPTETFAQIPDSISTPEYKLDCDNADEADAILDDFILHAKFPGASLSLVDGIRADYEDGWGLVRSSNTSACLTFRFEAGTQQRLDQLMQQFKAVFNNLKTSRTLPF
jgi:phosphomannomutase/phosphoglucomutase